MLKEYLVWAHKEVWALEENDETGKSFMIFKHFHKVLIANAVAMRRKLTEFKQSIFLNISFFCLQGETNKKKLVNKPTNTLRKSWSHSTEWQLRTFCGFWCAKCKTQLMAPLTHSLAWWLYILLETVQFCVFNRFIAIAFILDFT